MIGVILAAGYSVRLRPLGITQKAVVPVRWKGEVLPLVIHQILAMRKLTGQIFLVVGHEAKNVLHEVVSYGETAGVEPFFDKMIQGQGWAWKQLAPTLGDGEKICSLNVDDLHIALEDVVWPGDRDGASVAFMDDRSGLHAMYGLNDGKLKSLSRETGCGYFGTGIYILTKKLIGTMEPPKCGEFTADDGIAQLLGKVAYLYPLYENLEDWHDCGNVDGMRAIMSDEWRKT